MSGNRVVIDTNIAVFFLLGNEAVKKYFFQFNPVFSFISELELLSGKDFLPEELKDLKDFLSKQIVLDYIPAMKDIIIEIRQVKKLKLPDAIIAATAIYLDIPLVSSDKGFKNIPGLNLIYNEPSV
ncbi:type II toxin-antitoxin system VapC family toxin [Mucilaginibacter sp. S1162]|uniref:Type II toxin-antitoxin system VapC family toxin n=1 Tax=Mucilaginibacter humi TaxID=2732510 RepID=A0ABX1W3E4_9SPHI|nr:type II toxin-antitoxin system VapC family toxin [Mucilaginibacter humi]NNU34379.1 type II toxin-antitoxin system VapC family toxin [Mucilaginibacter humi]